jgi:MarR family transcriptional regulator, organic hydroperoxide resistance regulator
MPRQTPERFQLDPVLDFLRLLWAVEHGLEKTSKRMEGTVGITGPQRLVLRVVARFPGISAGELAHVVQLHPSTITGILQRLAARRLVVREKDPTDNRRMRLRLNPRAVKFTKPSSGTVENAVRRVLGRVGRQNVRGAREVLAALADALDNAPE